MFGTFLLYILYVLACISVLISIGASVYYFLQANKGLNVPLQVGEMLKSPALLLSETDFNEEGNQGRVRCIQALFTALGLIILVLLLRLILA